MQILQLLIGLSMALGGQIVSMCMNSLHHQCATCHDMCVTRHMALGFDWEQVLHSKIHGLLCQGIVGV